MCPVLKYMVINELTYQSALGHIETQFFKKKIIFKSVYFLYKELPFSICPKALGIKKGNP